MPDIVVKWIYSAGRATCVATRTSDGKQETWQATGSTISEFERHRIPKMLAEKLSAPLPPPRLGQVYFRRPVCQQCLGTGLWRCTRCKPGHTEFCACVDLWGDDDDENSQLGRASQAMQKGYWYK